jgi:hypothetical protein
MGILFLFGRFGLWVDRGTSEKFPLFTLEKKEGRDRGVREGQRTWFLSLLFRLKN